eukprot:CAMPEP_0202460228 /NCGR_PEP_ID=MMETSP1360-20130828/42533_1 /ASSEMBLY_ACC=CAM_ASM_000848 /TAXON_ID=515479 /ORGANISM="Licmophora paradoxa, Strain CCMP2313" /LENGTH=188 /DNA_ID=CAMNT_0049081787 /DNA_START=123 /DNA_END=689 /DNA_ORIENTATION=+
MGDSYKGLKQARQVVLDCMNNIHPVYNIKRLMIQKELAKDPKLAEEDWSRFLPKFQKKNVQRNKNAQKNKEKKPYTPFPPPQQPRKVDLQLDSGEYFAPEKVRKARELAQKKYTSKQKSVQKRNKRDADLEAVPDTKRRKQDADSTSTTTTEVNLDKLKSNIASRGGATAKATLSDFVSVKSDKPRRS